MSTIIEVSNLSFSYPIDEEKVAPVVLHDINMEIKEGEFVAILGHNGCGKSTLAKHFNGILRADEGFVKVMGLDAGDENNLLEIRRNVGMVFQNPDNQIIATVVEEDVAFALENLGVPHDEMVHRVDEALDLVGLSEFRNRAPHMLSGGQKQRVAIAGILAMKPKCIILDEPTAMLDPNGRKEVIRTVRELNRAEGITVILITHYMEEVIEADRVYVMDGGRVVMEGTPKEVFARTEELKGYRLDVPQVTELAWELKKAGLPLADGILTIDDFVDEILEIHEKSGK